MESKVKASRGTCIELSPSERIRADGDGVFYERRVPGVKIHQPEAASQEEIPRPVKRRNLALSEMFKMGIAGFHGRDSLQFKAAVYDEISAALERGGVNLLTPEFLRQAGTENSKPAKSAPSTQEVIEAYLTNKADGGAADGYLKVQRRKLNVFARQYPRLPAEPETVRIFLRQFKTDYVCTRQDYWKALKMLYDYAARNYGVPNPMLEVDKPRFRKKPGQRLSRDQAKQYLSALRTDLEWAITICCFGLRLRRIEAERLSWDDIKSDYIFVWGKERAEELPLLPIFREMLLKLRNDSHDGQVLSLKADAIAYHVQRVFKRAGIESGQKGPHILRNTAGRLWLTYGGDDRANRQLLRHSDQSMTDHYSVLGLDELMAMDERFNPMLNLMRELGLVCPNITGVRATEAEPALKDSLAYAAAPAELLPQVLDRMIALGQLAQELKHSLGGNGHWPEQLKEIKTMLGALGQK